MYNLSMSDSATKAIKKQPKGPRFSPKRIGSSIKKDGINPRLYNRLKLPHSCEECSHFKAANESCTLGFPTEPHLQRNQIKSYELSGKVALCRFQEID